MLSKTFNAQVLPRETRPHKEELALLPEGIFLQCAFSLKPDALQLSEGILTAVSQDIALVSRDAQGQQNRVLIAVALGYTHLEALALGCSLLSLDHRLRLLGHFAPVGVCVQLPKTEQVQCVGRRRQRQHETGCESQGDPSTYHDRVVFQMFLLHFLVPFRDPASLSSPEFHRLRDQLLVDPGQGIGYQLAIHAIIPSFFK